MSLEREFQTILIGSVYATDCQDRWYVARAPERTATYPYGVIQLAGADPHHVHPGPTDLQTRTLEIAIYSTKQDDVIEVADQVRVLIDGFTGNSGPLTIKATFYRNQAYNFEEVTKLHGSLMHFEVSFI